MSANQYYAEQPYQGPAPGYPGQGGYPPQDYAAQQAPPPVCLLQSPIYPSHRAPDLISSTKLVVQHILALPVPTVSR
ncbi:hypothetical protein IAR55_001289 [Kwoniella newhampshirensis]|uniref:Uncharacterized protein n=1 Tax=Kwoniella newhampshirensis TaxID=1651941 RepID=A0AAW0Z5L9_9TREE